MPGTAAFPTAHKPGWKREHSWDRGAGPWYKGSRIRPESMLLYQGWRMKLHFPSCSDAD